jgi:putative ABC transport system permease protein
MTGLNVPSWAAVAASALLVVVAAAVAHRQRLHLTRELLVAAGRAAIQLIAVGAVLLVVFAHAGTLGALGWVTGMVIIAGQVAARHGHRLSKARRIATLAVAAGSASTLGALLALRVISPQPRVVIPVGGMIVSGAMVATGLALRRIQEDAENARAAIETRLCLGLTAHEAFLPHRRSAMRTALQPAIDSTKVVGLISLPGAMTGLILAGVDPLTAIRHQIVVMYMLLAATALAALAAAGQAEHALFDAAHRLVPLTDPPKPSR